MKSLNYADRKREIIIFSVYFFITLIILTTSCVFTIITAQKGVSLLERKKDTYEEIFKKQAELSFHLDKTFKNLYSLKTKRRNISEHRQMQMIINNERTYIKQEIEDAKTENYQYDIYLVLLEQVKTIQETMDYLEKESDKREYNMGQLELCRKKYKELSKKKNK